MTTIPNVYRSFVAQLMHMVILPVFYIIFLMLYRPLQIESFLTAEWIGVHITIISCIILVSVIITRLLFYYLPMKINYSVYALWCFGEMIFMSFFVALYVWLIFNKHSLYYSVFMDCLKYVSLTLVFPYVILSMALKLYSYSHKTEEVDENQQRMRFYDNKHNLKLVVHPSAVLYIEAEENYVNINYLELDKERTFVLRSSMRAIEELCMLHGLVRCHRSYYINPSHVKVLRKDKEGIVYAELDSVSSRHIPVTKRYYEHLSDMLV